MPIRFLLFAGGDSSFYLKREGETPTWHFSDLLEALAFVYETKGDADAHLVVYDSMGRVAFKDMQVGTESEFLFRKIGNARRPSFQSALDPHPKREIGVCH